MNRRRETAMKSKLTAAAVVAGTSFLAGGMVLSSPVSARADAVLVGTTAEATGLTGLVVDGNTYNVSFIHNSYDNVYPSNDPIFAGNSTLAADAAQALATALNTLSVTGIAGVGPSTEFRPKKVAVAETHNRRQRHLVGPDFLPTYGGRRPC